MKDTGSCQHCTALLCPCHHRVCCQQLLLHVHSGTGLSFLALFPPLSPLLSLVLPFGLGWLSSAGLVVAPWANYVTVPRDSASCSDTATASSVWIPECDRRPEKTSRADWNMLPSRTAMAQAPWESAHSESCCHSVWAQPCLCRPAHTAAPVCTRTVPIHLLLASLPAWKRAAWAEVPQLSDGRVKSLSPGDPLSSSAC